MAAIYRVVVMLLLTVGVAQAQVLDARPPRFSDKWLYSIGAFGGLPLGDFAKHENGGGGFELMVGFQPFRREPLSIRTHVAWMIYGSVTGTAYQDTCDIFGCRTETVEYNARDHVMTSWHIGPEFFATDGYFRPFAYAMLGTTWFNSWANLQPESPGGASGNSVTLFRSNNFSTAYGAGVRFVTSRFGREYGWELSARVNRNAKATYLTEQGVHIDSTKNQWDITPTQTAAHVLSFHVGLFIAPYINWNERRP